MTQDLRFGTGAISEVAGILDALGSRRVLVVRSRSSFYSSGAAEALTEPLRARRTSEFAYSSPNPSAHDLEAALAAKRSLGPDVILGVGGGTAIDLAKLVAGEAIVAQSVPGLTADATSEGVPMVAVPTTAGSGAEATQFAVLYVGNRKQSIDDGRLLPQFAVVDPELTMSMPALVTSATGLDAFAQSIESLWSVQSTEESLHLATEAAQLSWNTLEHAVVNPDLETRTAMARASHLAGRAINISRTTGPHALSYYFTAMFDVPHGHAVGLTLGRFIVHNGHVEDHDVIDRRGAGHVQGIIESVARIMRASSPEEAHDALREKMQRISAPVTLSEAKVPIAAIPDIVTSVNAERLQNNPRRVQPSDIVDILKSLR